METKTRKPVLVAKILYGLVMIIILSQLILRWVANHKHEGKQIGTKDYQLLSENRTIRFPLPHQNSLAIFWATWCAPCKLEMNRLKRSVDEGKIDRTQIFAINPFETDDVVKKFLQRESFPFQFISASGITHALDVSVTPTTLLLEGNHIHSMSSGLSLIGIWRAEYFLQKD